MLAAYRRNAVAFKGLPLAASLADQRDNLIKKWIDGILQTYPGSMTKFLSQEKDPFRNPIGHTLKESLTAIFDGLIQSPDTASLVPMLDNIVRMRAVSCLRSKPAWSLGHPPARRSSQRSGRR